MIEIKRTKSTILIVDLPEGAHSVTFGGNMFSYKIDSNYYYLKIKETGQWELIGKTFELTEEQCSAIVPKMKDSGYPFEVQLYRETFDDMLAANKVYKENPYSTFECPNQWCENGYIDQGYNEKWRCVYCQENEDSEDEAQSRTMPNSVILIKR